MIRACGARGELERILLDIFLAAMLRARERLTRPPVVGDFVIVPLREDRNLAIEREHVLIEQIVFVVATELRQRLGRLGLVFGHDIAPELAVGHLLLGRDRTIGIDVIAVVDEKIGLVAQHGRVGTHPAARFVDPPALPSGVARPDERQRSSVRGGGTEMTHDGLADDGRRGEVGKPDAIEDVLAGGKMLEQHAGSEVGLRQGIDEARRLHRLEALGRRPLYQHARRPICPRPDHAGAGGHVAGLDAVRDHGAIGSATQVRPRYAAECTNRRDRSRICNKPPAGRPHDRCAHLILRKAYARA